MTDVFINEAIGRNIRRNERPDAKQIIVPSGKDTDDDALTEDLSDAIRMAVAKTHALRLINRAGEARSDE